MAEPHSPAHAWEVLTHELRLFTYAARDIVDPTCPGDLALDNWRRVMTAECYTVDPELIWDGHIKWTK